MFNFFTFLIIIRILIYLVLFVGQGQEGLNLVFLEETAVLSQFLRHCLCLVGLGEFKGISIDDISSDVLFQSSDNLKCLLVLFDGSNKELVAVALILLKTLNLSCDLISSGLIPSQVVLGLLEDLFVVFSVGDGRVEQFLVQGLDLGEGFNGPNKLIH